jgi:hypothetical protein
MHKFLLLLLIQVPLAGFSQRYSEYYTLVNKAAICRLDSNYAEAFSYLQTALTRFSGYTMDYDNAIELALKLNKRKEAIKLAEMAVSRCGFQFFNTSLDKDTYEYEDSLFVAAVKNNYERWRKVFVASQTDIERKISYKIKGMAEADQDVRFFIHTEDSTTWKYTNMIDSVNYFDFKQIVLSHGFPVICKYDQSVKQSLELLILHFRTLPVVTGVSNEEMKWFDSTLLAQMELGNVHPGLFAFAYDRYYCLKSGKEKRGEKQYYGTFNYRTRYVDIDDISHLDERAGKIHLLPLYYRTKLTRLPLPADYRYSKENDPYSIRQQR